METNRQNDKKKKKLQKDKEQKNTIFIQKQDMQLLKLPVLKITKFQL